MESIIDTQTLTNFINESTSSANVNSPSINVTSHNNQSVTLMMEESEYIIAESNITHNVFFNIPSSSVTIAQSNYKVSKEPKPMFVVEPSSMNEKNQSPAIYLSLNSDIYN